MSEGAGRAYGGKLPADRREARRQRLVAAGLQLFGTRGFRNTTIAELCREAAVAPGKFYEEFQNKEAVLLAVAVDVGDAVTAAVVAALRSEPLVAGGDLLATARCGLSAFCHALLDDPRRARVWVLEVVGVSPEVEVQRRQVLEGFAVLILRSFRTFTGEPESERPKTERERIVTNALVGGANEAISAWLLRGDPPPVDELVESLAGMYAAVGFWLADERGTLDSPATLKK
jgi:AcrR family transcriptional regulator